MVHKQISRLIKIASVTNVCVQLNSFLKKEKEKENARYEYLSTRKPMTEVINLWEQTNGNEDIPESLK